MITIKKTENNNLIINFKIEKLEINWYNQTRELLINWMLELEKQKKIIDFIYSKKV